MCNNPNGHGHNYVLEVTVRGEIDPKTGMVIDLKYLKDLVQNQIISKVDHKNLNVDVAFLENIIPTAENIAVKFWEILKPQINVAENAELHEIRLFESERNFVVYRGTSYERSGTTATS